MKRKTYKSKWGLIFGLVFLSVIAYFSVKLLMPTPQSSDIFLIDSSPIVFGETTITGVLRKDTPVGVDGDFLIILEDGRPVVLDINNMDHLIDSNVTIRGLLKQAKDDFSPMTMQVSSLTVLD